MSFAPAAMAHETRQVAGHEVVIGLIDEPVYSGQKSGMELFVTRGGQPVEGLQTALKAEVTFRESRMDLPLRPRFGEAGWYESVFFPTAAGPYTFRVTGNLGGTTIDESFTSSPTGFNEVQEQSAGQFPVRFPTQAEIVAGSTSGTEAANRATLALAAGVGGLVLGLAALGVALASRRQRR
jgi:hypothetical protein